MGYEFSNRRGSEGIHPVQRGKTIEECTKLFDDEKFDNEEKASTYIYKAFTGDYDFPIHESLKDNISHVRLVDMLTFDRENFAKNISTAVKKKVKIESKWNLVRLSDICEFIGKGKRPASFATDNGKIPFIISSVFTKKCDIADFNMKALIIGDGGSANVHYMDSPFSASDHTYILEKKTDKINLKFIYDVLSNNLSLIESGFKGSSLKNVSKNYLMELQIPLPPLSEQQKIVSEIEVLEKKEAEAKKKIEKEKGQIFSLLAEFPKGNISDLCHISAEKCNPQDNPDKEYLYLGLEHIESNTGIYFDNFEQGRNILSTKNVFRKGDVLYGKLRPYLNKVAIAQNDGVCSTDILVLKTDVSQILKYALLSEELVKQTSDLMKGVSLPRIGIEDFLTQKIPFPPLSVQQQIVAEIETIETQIAELETEIKEMPHKKESILKKYL